MDDHLTSKHLRDLAGYLLTIATRMDAGDVTHKHGGFSLSVERDDLDDCLNSRAVSAKPVPFAVHFQADAHFVAMARGDAAWLALGVDPLAGLKKAETSGGGES